MLNVNMLHPYAAFQLFEGTATSIQNMSALALGVAQQLATSGTNNSNIVVVTQSALPSSTTTNGIAIHFKKTTQAAWTADTTVMDVEQHILVLISNGHILGMSASATEARKAY
ncbi:hypothetical protein LP420_22495 [Massilia sp. B-10]|nr:hypothetical protein LP420_22495 [Massilia sp. B-10]